MGDYVPTLRTVLDRAVTIATGGRAIAARPAQAELAEAVEHAFETTGRLAAEAPTGSGKSLAVIVPAMLAAAKGERTVISTETLGLQAQIVSKDGPAAAEAAYEATGYRPVLAALKGWSNCGCGLAAAQVVGYGSEALKAAATSSDPLKRLAAWVLLEGSSGGSGDRADCPLDVGDAHWAKVSIGPTSCPGQDRCPFGATCRPAAAKGAAAGADIIVTNHSLLAMQVVTGAPVVIGGEQLGQIDHLVVDEAHSLADKVRSHGTATVSAGALISAARALEACLGRKHRSAAQGFELAKALDAQLAASLGRFGAEKALAATAEPLDGAGGVIEAWAARERRALRPGRGGLLAVAAALGKLDDLSDNLRRASRADMARWLEPGEPYELGSAKLTGARLVVAPVETAGAIAGNLFGSAKKDEDDDKPRLSVVVLSATLPSSALPGLGVGVKRTVYPSPFGDAYKESLLYVPKLGASSPSPLDRRGKFDVTAHQAWAEPVIRRLVDANGGSALVLTATSAAGRRYTAALRADGRHKVHSQWDGPVGRAVQAWREDTGSVLVGTRSLMTGVDAPGATCTLVIVDRVPRAAPNPVDDARRDALAAKLDLDRWGADRLVYVDDAVLLLSQAAGRLVRSSSDRGMVAVLDPRLLKGPVAYPEPTRRALLGGVERFVTKTTDLERALAFLAAAKGPAGAEELAG